MLTSGQFAAVVLDRLGNTRDHDLGRRVGFWCVGFYLVNLVFCLEVGDELLGIREQGGRAGSGREDEADGGVASDLNQIGTVEAVSAKQLGLDALFTRLLEQHSALVVNAAVVDYVRIQRGNRSQNGVEVRAFFSGLVAEDLHAHAFNSISEGISNAVTVGGLVRDDIYGLGIQYRGDVLGSNRALNVVTSAYAVCDHVCAVTICDLRIGASMRKHRQVGPGIDLS